MAPRAKSAGPEQQGDRVHPGDRVNPSLRLRGGAAKKGGSKKAAGKKAGKRADCSSDYEAVDDGEASSSEEEFEDGSEHPDEEEQYNCSDDDDDVDGDAVMFDEDEKPKKRKSCMQTKLAARGGAVEGTKRKALDESYAPLSTLPAIFEDLVTNANAEGGFDKVIEHLDGQTLRVATMCSGTESPLLALEMITRAFKETTGQQLRVEHKFSAEIEPFKQAYIERNFAPRKLFRDVCELGNEEARTAYGGMVTVPRDVDLLIAGTSCVDYSGLNRKKKGLAEKGESGRTFYGMLAYVERNQTPIVVLENVAGCPWDDVVVEFDRIGYSAAFHRLDTKHYYIPHTRSRGYLIATPKAPSLKSAATSETRVHRWVAELKRLKRPASSPLEAFMLPNDDPRIHRTRQVWAEHAFHKDVKGSKAVDWLKCEGRHDRAREEENLGRRRALTNWQDGGAPPTLPDGGWNDWACCQTERVTDLMDINFLRHAAKGVDITYKAAVWNLSQNVDRENGSVTLGVAPCLTPTMVPYLLNRGGPITGLEALSLQGLPIEQLLLTRESEDQLADLAGNAMSATVVGAAMLAALMAAFPAIHKREGGDKDEAGGKMLDGARIVAPEDKVRGDSRLSEKPVDLSQCEPITRSTLEHATQAVRMCACEGRTGMAKGPIWRCTACGHTTCQQHKAKPDHKYELYDIERLDAGVFQSEIKSRLPMRFTLDGFDLGSLKAKVDEQRTAGVPLEEHIIDNFIARIAAAINGHELHFHSLTRRSTWVANYSTDNARLELHFEPTQLEWRLVVDPPKDCAINDPLRKALEQPIARMVLSTAASIESLIAGEWDISLPLEDPKLDIILSNEGPWVQSWRAKLGLPEFADEKRSAQIRVDVPEQTKTFLDRDISGLYQLQEDCATAANSLYKRIKHNGEDADPSEMPLFFFLDPTRSLQPEHDGYTFSHVCARLDYGTFRPTAATVNRDWRPSETTTSQRERVYISNRWAAFPEAHIQKAEQDESLFAIPIGGFALTAPVDGCLFADNLLRATVKLDTIIKMPWAQPDWSEIDLLHQGPQLFEKLAFVLARIPGWNALAEWQSMSDEHLHADCSRCTPSAPSIEWVRTKAGANSFEAVENGLEAAAFEQAIKARPTPIVILVKQSSDKVLELKVGFNAATLVHRAIGLLPAYSSHRTFDVSAAEVSWRLVSNDTVQIPLGKSGQQVVFTLPDNMRDEVVEQPPHFGSKPLRPEQLRSLGWMISRETDVQPWEEEEVAEAVVPQLGWHAEALVKRFANVRGGVICDEVGYGKTAICIGLIDAMKAKYKVPNMTDRIAVRATLVVVPGHLCKQWPAEFQKFTGGKLDLVRIIDIKDLKSVTIKRIREADVVLVSETIFKSDLLWPALGDFSASLRGIPKTDKAASRYFRTNVEDALDALGEQIGCLIDPEQGPTAVAERIAAAREARLQRAEGADLGGKKRANKLAMEQLEDELDHSTMTEKQKVAAIKKEKTRAAKAEKLVSAAVKANAKEAKRVDILDSLWDLDGDTAADWTRMHCPPLHAFHFQRLVCDEFTYLEGSVLTAVKSLRAGARWILSGTPPLSSFDDIRRIADLLHVHLGVIDTSPSVTVKKESEKEAKKKDADKTAAEKFHSFREVMSTEWYNRRDRVAQRFLNMFARQNKAEIDAIPFSEKLVRVELPAAEMAIYRELEHHLLALDQNLTRVAKIKQEKKGDREKRLSEALGVSKSPEEALIKRCNHYSLDLELEERLKQEDAPHVCELIFKIREGQFESCKREMRAILRAGAFMQRWAEKFKSYETAAINKGASKPDQHFKQWVRAQLQPDAGNSDNEIRDSLAELIAETGWSEEGVVPLAKGESGEADDEDEAEMVEAHLRDWRAAAKEKQEAKPSDTIKKDRNWELRNLSSKARNLYKEFVGRQRSTRFFAEIRDAQKDLDGAKATDIAILSACGHKGPVDEVEAYAKDNKCLEPGCTAPIQATNIVRADQLGTSATSGNFGIKLETLVDLIEQIPKDDKILIFVQFDDLFEKVREALHAYAIPADYYRGGAKNMSSTLDQFQKPDNNQTRVLILNVADSSAAGANLTVANHAFFISPLLTDSQHKYDQAETQAIGRIRRYGQTKHVNIYRLLAQSTKDEVVFEERTQTKVDDIVARQAFKFSPKPDGDKRARKNKPDSFVKFAEKKKKAARKKKADDDGSEADEDETPKKKAAAKKAPAKKAPAKGKGKKKQESSEEEDDESAEETAQESEASGAEADSEPVAPREKRSRGAKSKAVAVIDFSDEDEDDDEPAPPPKKAKTTQVRVKASPAPAARPTRASKKRVVEDSDPASDSELEIIEPAPKPPPKKKASPAPVESPRASLISAKAGPTSSLSKVTASSIKPVTTPTKKARTAAAEPKPSGQRTVDSFFPKREPPRASAEWPAKKQCRPSLEAIIIPRPTPSQKRGRWSWPAKSASQRGKAASPTPEAGDEDDSSPVAQSPLQTSDALAASPSGTTLVGSDAGDKVELIDEVEQEEPMEVDA